MNRIVKQGISLFTMLVLLSAMLASAVPAFAADKEYEPDPVVYSDKQTVSKNTPFEATFVFDHSDYSSATSVERIDIDVSSVTSSISLGKKSYTTDKNEILWTNDTDIELPTSSEDEDSTRVDFGYKLTIPEKYMKRVNDKVGTLRFKISYYDKNNSKINSFTVQKTIFDPVGDGTSSDDEDEEDNPVLTVTSYSTDPASGIKEGDAFNLKVTVKNNSNVVCNNIVAAFDNANAPEIAMRGATDTLYIDSLPAQATATLTYPLVCSAKMETKSYPLSVKFTSSDLAADASVAPRMFIPVQGTKVSADEEESSNSSVPQIIIESYDYGGMSVTGGTEFMLTMNFRNTSPNIAIENLKMTVSSAPDGDEGIVAFTPSRSSNTFFIQNVKGGGSFQEKIALYPKVDAAPKSYGVTIDYTYEAVVDGIRKADLKGTETISIPLTQPDRFEINQVDLFGPIYMGDQGQLSISYVNKGKSKIFNLAVDLEGNFTSEDMSTYIGNVESGTGDSFDASLTPMDVGTMAGTATFTYEDSNGETKEIKKEFSCDVIPLPTDMGGEVIGGDMPVDGDVTAAAGPPAWAIGLTVCGGVLLLIVILVFVRKKLKARKLRMLEAEDDYDDISPEDTVK